MIKIEKLTKSDFGRWVEYTNGVGEKELGRIKSWTGKYIFVVYETSGKDMDNFFKYTAASTKPEDLNFVSEKNE